jgi:hypothetical protein
MKEGIFCRARTGSWSWLLDSMDMANAKDTNAMWFAYGSLLKIAFRRRAFTNDNAVSFIP